LLVRIVADAILPVKLALLVRIDEQADSKKRG
jgi:hypothetical protein